MSGGGADGDRAPVATCAHSTDFRMPGMYCRTEVWTGVPVSFSPSFPSDNQELNSPEHELVHFTEFRMFGVYMRTLIWASRGGSVPVADSESSGELVRMRMESSSSEQPVGVVSQPPPNA